MLITIVAGARPNFVKIAPIISALHQFQEDGKNINYRLVHTGQHFDDEMSTTFFTQLNIPKPNINLECGGGTQAEQTAAIMIKFENELSNFKPDVVLVVGDVTSTLACSITAKKMLVKLAHVEAGIRSGDMSMPEEINRLVTDSITDYFFTTSEFANDNLMKSGVSESCIFFVGNTMIDTLLSNEHRLQKPRFWNEFQLEQNQYIVLTLHRPANVDQDENLRMLINEILANSNGLKIVFPVHPRTRQILNRLNVFHQNLIITEPLPYLEFNYLVKNSKVVITDSGGITEETTVLGVPCMTLRSNTERPETVLIGTNELLGTDPKAIGPAMDKLFEGRWKKGSIPPFWDGNTSKRIIEILLNNNILSGKIN